MLSWLFVNLKIPILAIIFMWLGSATVWICTTHSWFFGCWSDHLSKSNTMGSTTNDDDAVQ